MEWSILAKSPESAASRREEANESRPVRRLQCVSALNFAPVLGCTASSSDLPILIRIGPFARLLNGWAGEEVSGCDSQGAPRLSRSGLVGEADQPRASYVAQHDAPAWIARLQTAGARGLHTRLRRAGGPSTPTSDAARAGAATVIALTIEVDPSPGG